jgi:hypothetical protein
MWLSREADRTPGKRENSPWRSSLLEFIPNLLSAGATPNAERYEDCERFKMVLKLREALTVRL